jgi:hypothetical protein
MRSDPQPALPLSPSPPPQLSHQSEQELDLKGKAVKAFTPYYPGARCAGLEQRGALARGAAAHQWARASGSCHWGCLGGCWRRSTRCKPTRADSQPRPRPRPRPRPPHRDETWWLLLADPAANALLSVNKVSLRDAEGAAFEHKELLADGGLEKGQQGSQAQQGGGGSSSELTVVDADGKGKQQQGQQQQAQQQQRRGSDSSGDSGDEEQEVGRAAPAWLGAARAAAGSALWAALPGRQGCWDAASMLSLRQLARHP